MNLPSFECYCENTTAANALVFDLGPIKVWYSYKTPIAFQTNHGVVVSENIWGPTTGKHLNAIDGGDKKSRLPSAEFENKLADTLESIFALVKS